MWIEKKLDKKETLLFFLSLSMLYVFPIVHADYLYIDDQWRSLLLVDDLWRMQGRLFSELLYNALTFTSSMPNIFPLPLLLSMVAISFAMRSLVFHFYSEASFSKCLVVLPLLCSPFFLGNLTYQYDGPAMVLAVAAIIAAITMPIKNTTLNVILPACLITVALGLYQLTISLFIALCCCELIVHLSRKTTWRSFFTLATLRVFQLISGAILYAFTAHALSNTNRGKPLTIDAMWAHVIEHRLEVTAEKIGLLNSQGMGWTAAMLLLFAGIGGAFLVKQALANEPGVLGKSGVLLALCFMAVVLSLCVPGAMLFLSENRLDARNLIGFSALLMLLFYLAHKGLECIHRWAGLVLIVPCLGMFSLSYMYGQVLNAKKEYEASLSSSIAYDLTSRAELKGVENFNFSLPNDESSAYWVPASEGTIALIPVIGYLLSSDNTVLFPDRFRRLGINRVFWIKESIKRSMEKNEGEKIVDNKQYTIYLIGNEGLIQLKSHKEMVAPGSAGQ